MLPTIYENFKIKAQQIQNAEGNFRILDRLGLNFEAINLKFFQIVGPIAVYNF